MASPNINLRDPVLYRIVHAAHPRTGDAWCIYPTYDFAHGQSDAIEGVTHSICTLEFEGHRPLYDWLVEHLPVPHVPHQYEFARLNLTYTVLSKRVLLRLVTEGHVRAGTTRGCRRSRACAGGASRPRGSASSRRMIGVARTDWSSRWASSSRGPQRAQSHRATTVRRPGSLKVVITNWPEGQVETLEVVNNPEDATAGTRPVEFSRDLWIDREDFLEEPPPKFFRLAPVARCASGTRTS